MIAHIIHNHYQSKLLDLERDTIFLDRTFVLEVLEFIVSTVLLKPPDET